MTVNNEKGKQLSISSLFARKKRKSQDHNDIIYYNRNLQVEKNGVAGSIDKWARPNGPKRRGLRLHQSIIKISKSDWSEE